MAFGPGEGGRKKGATNIRTRHAEEVMRQVNFNPISAMIDIYKIAMMRFTEELEKVEGNRISPMECEAVKYLKIASDNVSDLAAYVYPKLKSVEQVKLTDGDSLSPLERLELMKNAVKMLEAQIGSTRGSGSP